MTEERKPTKPIHRPGITRREELEAAIRRVEDITLHTADPVIAALGEAILALAASKERGAA